MYDVIVVGAGISGLAAAKKLNQAAKNVLLLEARDRIGGRLHTDRQFTVPVDLGGSWAHDLDRNILAQTAEFDLALRPFNGLLAQCEAHALYDENYDQLSAELLQDIPGIVEEVFQQLSSQSSTQDLSETLKQLRYDKFPPRQLLAIKSWISHLLACWSGAELSDVSATVWQSMQQESGNAYVLNGYDTLLKKLSASITLYLQSVVTKIDYSREINQVYVGDKIYQARTVIISLPIGVLKGGQCHFIPELPAQKLTTIAAMGSGVLEKALIKFPHCFWERQALSIQQFSTAENPIQLYINYQALLGAPILLAMYGGEVVKNLANTSPADFKEILLQPLREIYRDNFVMPEKIIRTDWYGDPYSQGAYAYLPRGQQETIFQQLAQPVADCLFFAGEATESQCYATVHGAYNSGLRAADEVLQVLN